MIYSAEVRLQTRGNAEIHDLTPQVKEITHKAGFQEGMLCIFTPSSTSAITTIEYESGALEDLRRVLDEIVPPHEEYRHNLRWGDNNGHAHVRAALLGPSLMVPLRNGALTLGTWQQIAFIDFDNRPRQRTIIVQILGQPH
jgi:secondary thiamine-phosphate synthase enzyme